MNRLKVATLLFGLSLLLFTPFATDAQAQANPEAAKILAKINLLKLKKAPLVSEKIAKDKALTRVTLDLIQIESDIAWATKKLSEAQAELAMAQNPAAIDSWEDRVQGWTRALLVENRRKQIALDTKQTLEKRIGGLDEKIAKIDKQLIKLYQRLAEII